MSAVLLRLLPHVGIGLAIIGAIVGAVWWIDDAGYDRAMRQRDAANAAMLEEVRTELRRSEQRLALAIDGIAGDYQGQRERLARAGATLQPIILKEAARDPRLSDPALGLPPGMLDALNRARAAGACAAAASGRIGCALPAPAADPGSGDR